MQDKPKLSLSLMDDYSRNARLYLHLTSLGLVTIPVFTDVNVSDDIEYIIVSCKRDLKPFPYQIPQDTTACNVPSPLHSSPVSEDVLTSEHKGCTVINMPTKR